MADFGLDLDGLREKTRQIKEKELADEFGNDVKVNLHLPSGQEEIATFKMGTLVSYVKAYIQEQYGHPMGKMKLLLKNSPMLDPLSLSDVPGLSQGSVNLINISLDD